MKEINKDEEDELAALVTCIIAVASDLHRLTTHVRTGTFTLDEAASKMQASHPGTASYNTGIVAEAGLAVAMFTNLLAVYVIKEERDSILQMKVLMDAIMDGNEIFIKSKKKRGKGNAWGD
ncbi:MAG: hypothetical protein Q6370_004070 [Candidatus Sigynarchaeota archaeon]